MKAYRKFLAMVMVPALALTLAACGGQESGNDKSADTDSGASSENTEQAEFVLKGNSEFVVPYSAGGGSDTNARVIAKILQDEGIIDGNLMVVNKPGGSGAVGNTYTANKSGDNQTIMTWVTGQQSSAMVNNAEVTLEDVTPLATLALDSFVLVVDADSPYQTFEDLAAAAEANPGQISVGGAGKGGEDHVVLHMLMKETGLDFKFVTFQGGGEIMSALLGGHIDAQFANPNEVIPQIAGGELRALAVSAKESLDAPLDNVPSFTDLGYPGVYFEQFRGIVGPPDMSPEAIAFWEEKLLKVTESPEWQENYIKANSLTPASLNAEESKAFFEETDKVLHEILTEMGVIK